MRKTRKALKFIQIFETANAPIPFLPKPFESSQVPGRSYPFISLIQNFPGLDIHNVSRYYKLEGLNFVIKKFRAVYRGTHYYLSELYVLLMLEYASFIIFSFTQPSHAIVAVAVHATLMYIESVVLVIGVISFLIQDSIITNNFAETNPREPPNG